jgi:hypothetical protein
MTANILKAFRYRRSPCELQRSAHDAPPMTGVRAECYTDLPECSKERGFFVSANVFFQKGID